jgi:hypothetical protein
VKEGKPAARWAVEPPKGKDPIPKRGDAVSAVQVGPFTVKVKPSKVGDWNTLDEYIEKRVNEPDTEENPSDWGTLVETYHRNQDLFVAAALHLFTMGVRHRGGRRKGFRGLPGTRNGRERARYKAGIRALYLFLRWNINRPDRTTPPALERFCETLENPSAAKATRLCMKKAGFNVPDLASFSRYYCYTKPGLVERALARGVDSTGRPELIYYIPNMVVVGKTRDKAGKKQWFYPNCTVEKLKNGPPSAELAALLFLCLRGEAEPLFPTWPGLTELAELVNRFTADFRKPKP